MLARRLTRPAMTRPTSTRPRTGLSPASARAPPQPRVARIAACEQLDLLSLPGTRRRQRPGWPDHRQSGVDHVSRPDLRRRLRGEQPAGAASAQVVAYPDLIALKTRSGEFVIGQDVTYTVGVRNSGTAGPTTGPITVVDDVARRAGDPNGVRHELELLDRRPARHLRVRRPDAGRQGARRCPTSPSSRRWVPASIPTPSTRRGWIRQATRTWRTTPASTAPRAGPTSC